MAFFVTYSKKKMNLVPLFPCLNVCKPPQDPASPRGSPAHSPRENGLDKNRLVKKDAPLSPSSIASSSSTPSSKSKEINLVSHLGNYIPLIFLFIISQDSFLYLGILLKCKNQKHSLDGRSVGKGGFSVKYWTLRCRKQDCIQFCR